MWWKIKQLYADQNMLALRSPVSKRMFLSDFSFANILHKSCAFCSRLKTPTPLSLGKFILVLIKYPFNVSRKTYTDSTHSQKHTIC